MSKIAMFAAQDADSSAREALKLLRDSRARIARMCKDPQKDGADSEVLRNVIARLDVAIDKIEAI